MIRHRPYCCLAGKLGPGIQVRWHEFIHFTVIPAIAAIDVVCGQVDESGSSAETSAGNIGCPLDIDFERCRRISFNVAIIRDRSRMQNQVRFQRGDVCRDGFRVSDVEFVPRGRDKIAIEHSKLGSQEAGPSGQQYPHSLELRTQPGPPGKAECYSRCRWLSKPLCRAGIENH